MVLKSINAVEARTGVNIIIEGASCTVKKNDVSKTGKHGHAKCRIEAEGIIDGKKRVVVIPGHDKIEVPLVEKKKGQVLSVSDNRVSLMDLESFETMELSLPEELRGQVFENDNVEYWDVEGQKIVKRKV